jgi:hypothetical protein
MAVTFSLFKKKNEEEEKQPLIPASGFGTQYANNLNKSTTQRYVNSLTSGSGLPNTLGLPKPSFRSSEDMFNLSNDLLNKSRTYQRQQQKDDQQKPPPFSDKEQPTSLPSYITGYETLAERQKALLEEQNKQAQDYYNKAYAERNRLLEQSIPKLQSQVRTATANIQKGIGSAQQSAEYKKQNAEDQWGESQRLAAQTRNESEARNRNRFAALGTTDSWGAGSYGQAQENVESDFNRFTQQGLRTKEQNMFEIDRALQDYEIEAQTQIDTLEANLSNTVDQIQSSINLNNIDKQNMIDEAFAKYQQGVLAVEEGMQNVYAQYYQALQNAEANSLSFDDNGQPLNQASYEWMLNNPDKFGSTFGQQSQSSQKAIGLVDDLLKKVTRGITGRVRMAVSDEARAAQGLLDQLVAELQLEEARRMKGQGAMSDAERDILRNAIGALNLTKSGRSRLSDDQFRAELMRIKEGLGGLSSNQDYSQINTQLVNQFGG